MNHNEDLLIRAQDMWDKMHTERTNMLWSKEEYINSMHSYQQIIKKIESFELGLKNQVLNQPTKKKDVDEEEEGQPEEDDGTDPKDKEIIDNLKEGCERAKMNATAAENNYKRTLDNLNLTVELFRTDFSPMLNKIQASDIESTEYIQ